MLRTQGKCLGKRKHRWWRYLFSPIEIVFSLIRVRQHSLKSQGKKDNYAKTFRRSFDITTCAQSSGSGINHMIITIINIHVRIVVSRNVISKCKTIWNLPNLTSFHKRACKARWQCLVSGCLYGHCRHEANFFPARGTHLPCPTALRVGRGG